MFDTSILYKANLEAKETVVVNQGGTSSGKTYSIIQVLFSIAISEKATITVVGQDIPNLKVGALRDALEIYNNSEILKSLVLSYNKTDRIFEFASGSIIEFKSYDNGQDAKSGKRDYLFINEANGIPFDVFTELELRTRVRTFIDYNPNSEFWVHEKVLKRSDIKYIISDHRHNPFLSQQMRDKIEGLKDIDLELWKVYARGLTGKIEGLIFRNWDQIDKVPPEAKLICRGLDFGFTNDPTSLIEMYQYNGGLVLNELIYQTGLTNSDISQKMKSLGLNQRDYIVADSAEPKSIEELYRMGWNVHPAEKGNDSINNSIDILRRQKITVTKNSINLKKELNNYRWAVDKEGKTINKPVDFMNHAIDAVRYCALNKLKANTHGKYTIFNV